MDSHISAKRRTDYFRVDKSTQYETPEPPEENELTHSGSEIENNASEILYESITDERGRIIREVAVDETSSIDENCITRTNNEIQSQSAGDESDINQLEEHLQEENEFIMTGKLEENNVTFGNEEDIVELETILETEESKADFNGSNLNEARPNTAGIHGDSEEETELFFENASVTSEVENEMDREGSRNPTQPSSPDRHSQNTLSIEDAEVKNWDQDDVKDNSKNEVKDVVTDVVKDNIKDNVKDDFQDNVKDRMKNDVKDVVKDDAKDDVKDSYKGSVNESVNESVKDNVKDGVKDGVKDDVKDNDKDDVKDSLKDSDKESVKGSVKGSVKDSEDEGKEKDKNKNEDKPDDEGFDGDKDDESIPDQLSVNESLDPGEIQSLRGERKVSPDRESKDEESKSQKSEPAEQEDSVQKEIVESEKILQEMTNYEEKINERVFSKEETEMRKSQEGLPGMHSSKNSINEMFISNESISHIHDSKVVATEVSDSKEDISERCKIEENVSENPKSPEGLLEISNNAQSTTPALINSLENTSEMIEDTNSVVKTSDNDIQEEGISEIANSKTSTPEINKAAESRSRFTNPSEMDGTKEEISETREENPQSPNFVKEEIAENMEPASKDIYLRLSPTKGEIDWEPTPSCSGISDFDNSSFQENENEWNNSDSVSPNTQEMSSYTTEAPLATFTFSSDTEDIAESSSTNERRELEEFLTHEEFSKSYSSTEGTLSNVETPREDTSSEEKTKEDFSKPAIDYLKVQPYAETKSLNRKGNISSICICSTRSY